MISAEREQEIRKLIRAAQHNGNWEYVIDFEDVTDLLALCDEQKERIAALREWLISTKSYLGPLEQRMLNEFLDKDAAIEARVTQQQRRKYVADLSKQWRELADNLDETEEWLKPVKAALLAAADACDQRDIRIAAEVRQSDLHYAAVIKLRELLAAAREDFHSIEALSQEGGFESTIEGTAKRAIAAIDSATKTS